MFPASRIAVQSCLTRVCQRIYPCQDGPRVVRGVFVDPGNKLTSFSEPPTDIKRISCPPKLVTVKATGDPNFTRLVKDFGLHL